MIARLAMLAMLLLLPGGAHAQGAPPDHRWEAMRIDASEWPGAARPPKAVVTPVDLQSSVLVEIFCYPAANGMELRLQYNDADLAHETARPPEVPVRIDNNAAVRVVWAGQGEWRSGRLPPSFIDQMRNGSFIVVEWGVYMPARRNAPLRLHLRGARAALTALPALCR
jgi:hypothetical protein